MYIWAVVHGFVPPPLTDTMGARVDRPPPPMLWVPGLKLMIGPPPPKPCVDDRPPPTLC